MCFRPTRRGSTFTLGERAWLDGFDGNNDRGVFFAASLRDHSIYLLKWKTPQRARRSEFMVNVKEGSDKGAGGEANVPRSVIERPLVSVRQKMPATGNRMSRNGRSVAAKVFDLPESHDSEGRKPADTRQDQKKNAKGSPNISKLNMNDNEQENSSNHDDLNDEDDDTDSLFGSEG